MQVSVRTARSSLSKLIEAALGGEEVVISRRGKPVVRLVPITERPFKFGLLRDRLTGPGPDFFEPLDEADLARWEGGR